jgi:hypothetical protein
MFIDDLLFISMEAGYERRERLCISRTFTLRCDISLAIFSDF